MTYINLQVSSSNRANFSKIRRLAKGSKIKKFETPATPITLDFGLYFEPFLNDFANHEFTNGQTKSSIAWTPNWEGINGKYADVAALEASPLYQAFTKYVIENKDDPRVLNYLKTLESTTTGNAHDSILFDSDGNLVSDWATKYNNLRNDGKYGYYHLGPEGEPNTPPLDPPSEIPTGKTQQSYIPINYKSFDYKPGPYTDGYQIGATMFNSLAANRAIYENNKKKNVNLLQSKNIIARLHDNWLAREGLLQNVNKIQYGLNRIQGSDATANQYMALEGADKALEGYKKAAELQAEGYNTSLDNVMAARNATHQSRVDTFNTNLDRIQSFRRELINDKNKYILNRTDLLNTGIKEITDSILKYNLNERYNKDAAIDKQNEFYYTLFIRPEYEAYSNLAQSFGNSNAFTTFYNDILKGGKYGNTTLSGLDITKYKDKDAVLDWYLNNENAEKYRTEYNPLYNKELEAAKLAFENKQLEGLQNLKFLAAHKKDKLSNQGFVWFDNIMGRNKNRSWTDTFGIPMYDAKTKTYYLSNIAYKKQGGTIKDRFILYLEHNRKIMENADKRFMKDRDRTSKKLERDLDMLDKETLYLLRLIFK